MLPCRISTSQLRVLKENIYIYIFFFFESKISQERPPGTLCCKALGFFIGQEINMFYMFCLELLLTHSQACIKPGPLGVAKKFPVANNLSSVADTVRVGL